MKKLLLDIIRVRKQLIKDKKSRIDNIWAEQFMTNLSSWVNRGTDCYVICDLRDKEIRILMPKNFKIKYETLLKGHANSTAKIYPKILS